MMQKTYKCEDCGKEWPEAFSKAETWGVGTCESCREIRGKFLDDIARGDVLPSYRLQWADTAKLRDALQAIASHCSSILSGKAGNPHQSRLRGREWEVLTEFHKTAVEALENPLTNEHKTAIVSTDRKPRRGV